MDWKRDTWGNCYTWALIKRVTYYRIARIRWRWSDHGPWPHAAITFDDATYWCLVPKRFTQRQWMRNHRRPPFFFRGKVVRDFKRDEEVG